MKNHGFRLWTSLVIILALAVLAISCSQVTPGETATTPTDTEILTPSQTTSVETSAPTTTETLTPSQTTPIETQVSPTSTDLSWLIDSDPAKIDNSGFPITPVNQLHNTGITPDIDIAQYRLIVDGLVDTPLSLTYDAIMQYPTVTEVVLLICQGAFVDNAQWTGVPVTTILAAAGIQTEATKVIFQATDGYVITLSLDDARSDGVFLAHTVDGQALPKEQGFPVRLVIKGVYGGNWVKWINHIQIL